ncbi:MAG: Nif3-like dinuclear metal center hexameric protein [Oscillospiraceae bacterium]|nr:Nif3-like dinuclear metal center hexameric protein [Oscillospiraceae bacterium]
MKAYEIMEKLFALAREDADFSSTCDTCKAGDPEREVTKAAVAMTATPEVVRQAVRWGAELLIVHEPTYYDHWDGWADEVQQSEKRRLIEETGMVIWRYHDHPHRTVPDIIAQGMYRRLGLKGTPDHSRYGRFQLDEPMTALELAKVIEEKLGVKHVRIAGARDIPSTRISGIFGSADDWVYGELQGDWCEIALTGETCEWRTAEYARDAAQMGRNKAMIVLTHMGSERDGMVYAAEILKEICPELEVRYFESGLVYSYTDD